MSYDEKGLVHISYSALQLILLPQLLKMTHHHKNRCGCEIYIQARTYQESPNYWHKRELKCINYNENSFIRGTKEQLNADNIFYRYIEVLLPD